VTGGGLAGDVGDGHAGRHPVGRDIPHAQGSELPSLGTSMR
jgi:hypothetical protein